MNLKRVIKLFYFGYTIYVLMVVSSTSLTFTFILPAILLMWLNYFAFSAGYRVNPQKTGSEVLSDVKEGWIIRQNKITLTTLVFLSILFSILAVNYYTGQTPVSVVKKLMGHQNVSLYYEYQTYFKEQQRYVFSVSKLPFIFMMFYVKFIALFSYVDLLILTENKGRIYKLYLVIVTLSYIYIGVARGTNFEFFELVIMAIFIMMTRQHLGRFKFPVRSMLGIVGITAIMIFVYYLHVSARGVIFDYKISKDVYYDPDGILPTLFPFLSFITIMIYGYFGFGFYYLATYIADIWFLSPENFVAGLVPFGYVAAKGLTIHDIMKNLVDMGARWQPDTTVIINSFGLIVLLIGCFACGIFISYLQSRNLRDPMSLLACYMVLMQMISLPVANFVMASSASQLIALSLALYWTWKVFVRAKIRL